MKRFYVAALTGRSGSGKSYASEYLAEKGTLTIDSDVLAREVVEKGSKCLDELVEEFSSEILKADSTLDRKKLADICFANERKKSKLDRIIHPYIIERLLSCFDELKENGARYCVVEAGALVESGLYAVCDRIVMITADEDKQIERIMLRDGITLQQAQTRLEAQLHAAELKDLCDMIITNNGTLEEFDIKLDSLAGQLNLWFEQ